MDSAGTMAILPPGTPLIVDADGAAELFGVGKRVLQDLRIKHPDFPAGQIGGNNSKWLYDVPRCYAWFARYLGTDAAD